MSAKKTCLFKATSVGLLSLAALAVVGAVNVSAEEVEVANITAHGTGAYADPVPAFNLDTGELTAKGSSVLNSDYKPELDTSTVDIHVNGEGVTAELPEVKLGFENGEPYVYANGEGVTSSSELPTLDPSTVDIHVNGEGVTAPVLDEVAIALDENGLYFKNTPIEAPTAEALPTVKIGGKDGDYYLYTNGPGTTAEELPSIDPSTLSTAEVPTETPSETSTEKSTENPSDKQEEVVDKKVENPAVKADKATETKTAGAKTAKASLPETGDAVTLLSLFGGLGLLGSAALLKKRK
ncbi:TPA: LPXTG cell wall anchor domain-containing protein [Streptococcus suis]